MSKNWVTGKEIEPKWQDIMQVCLGGHIINSSYEKNPEYNEDFCPNCGKKTITQCPKCHADIRGKMHGTYAVPLKVKDNCGKCGAPFPWAKKDSSNDEGGNKSWNMNLHPTTIKKLRELINEETEYRSGLNLVAFFNNLGFNDSYGPGFPSRWAYTENKLNQINGSTKMEDCIKQLFSPVNFIGKFDILEKFINDFNKYLVFDDYKLFKQDKQIGIQRIRKTALYSNNGIKEDEFLNKEFKQISLEKLGCKGDIKSILDQRLDEIKRCLNAKSSLAVIFLCGSTLEGILLSVATQKPNEFNCSAASPKKDGKVLQFHEWTLNNFIDVAYSLGLLKEDVKKFSHILRDFRNYIHPYEQVSTGFNPDKHTAAICWQVLQAVIYQLSTSKVKNVKS